MQVCCKRSKEIPLFKSQARHYLTYEEVISIAFRDTLCFLFFDVNLMLPTPPVQMEQGGHFHPFQAQLS